MNDFLILLVACLLDYLIGDPPNWPHPIRYIGMIIKKYENLIRSLKWMNLKVGGFFLTGLTVGTVVLIVHLILLLARFIHPAVNLILSIYLIYTTLAAKCLDVETMKVHNALVNKDIHEGRKMLSYLVGRDTSQLNEGEVIRGAVETVAENTIDGVLAPLFYIAIGFFLGIPVQMAFMYKAINTLDSMVGYIQEPYTEIGFASAKLDDIANYVPARIGSFLMLIAGTILGYNGKNGLKILKRDRKNHKSPNCGYPESVAAGLLQIQLGGTNTYFGQSLYKPTIGDRISELESNHITDVIKVMYGSETVAIGVIVLATFIFIA